LSWPRGTRSPRKHESGSDMPPAWCGRLFQAAGVPPRGERQSVVRAVTQLTKGDGGEAQKKAGGNAAGHGLVIGRQEGCDRPAWPIVDEPEGLRLLGVLEDLKVIKAVVLAGKLLELHQAGGD